MLSVNRLLLSVALFCITALLAGCISSKAAANQAAPVTATSPPAEPTAAPPQPTASPTPLAPSATIAKATPPATVPPTLTPSPEPEPTLTPKPAATEASANTAELAAAGLQIYKDQYCGICHELDTAQTKGIFGPSHNDMAAVAAQRITDPHYTGSATTSAEYLYESLLEPKKYLVQGYANNRHAMPAYTHLTELQIEALVQFLLQQ